MLNLMASPLATEFEFIPFTTSRPAKQDVIDNWGYSAIFRGGIVRVCLGILVTIWHLMAFPFAIIRRSIAVVQIQASDYQVFWESVLYALIARILGRPVLFRIGGAFDLFHGGSPRLVQALIARALYVPTCIIVQSEFARAYIKRYGFAIKTLLLPNWSRTDPTTEPPPSNKDGIPIFFFVAGTEAIRKGINVVLAAAQRVALDNIPLRFHFVGVTPTLRERIRTMNIPNIERVEGPLAHEEILRLMREADVFLLPSYGEGFPNSLIEAMAAGMACIVTPVGAVPEIVAHGGALTVEVGKADELANAILRIAVDQNLRGRLSTESRDIISSRFTAEAVLSPLAKEYRSLICSRV